MTFGFIGEIAETDSVVWKTEGLTDAMAILDLKPPSGHVVTCNACGAGERPDRPDVLKYMSRFRGKEVFTVHDCDVPGQKGAIGDGKNHPGWANTISHYADSSRNVILPYDIQPTDGKDVKDWIWAKRENGEDPSAIYAELLAMARGCATIDPASVIDAKCQTSWEEEEGSGEEGSGEDPILPVESPDAPHRLAEVNLAVYEQEHGGRLCFWRQQWWKYRAGRYRQISGAELQAKVITAIKREFDSLWQEENERYEAWLASDAYDSASDKGTPFVRHVKQQLVQNVINAMKAICLRSNSIQMPSWLPDRSKPSLISLKNGLLSLDELFKPAEERDSSKILTDHSPDWFSAVRLPYRFDPSADCPRWKQFLQDVFAGDDESIEALQRWFGYLLLSDTSLQKMLYVIGRPRSGKGTIMRAMIGMLGRETIASPTLSDFASPFALQGMVDKTAAMIGEVRLSHRADDQMITERILAITGEDPQDVHRKHLEPLLGVKLQLRFTMFSNQLPQLNDSSSALMPRFIFLHMPNEYVGREDFNLGEKIEAELPGILNWAIAGRYRLQQEKVIHQPQSGVNIKDQMKRIGSPISVFIEECCHNEGDVINQDLFDAWQGWAEENEITWRPDIQRFLKKVQANF